MPPFVTKMSDSSRSAWDKVNDFTNITKVASNHLWVCNDMAKNFIVYANKKATAFGGFTPFMTGFFQNLLAKVISINNIYTSLNNNNNNGNVTGVYYDLGRMTRILIDFEPIEAESFLAMLKEMMGEQDPSYFNGTNGEKNM